ncbi:MAG: DUF975 family protein [Lachnospiraceae bacterium]
MKTYYTTKQLKAAAREQLHTNWKKSVGITAFMLLLSILYFTLSLTSASMFSVILSYAYPLLEAIFQVGVLSFFLKIACGYGHEATLDDIFYGFRHKPSTIILLYLLFTIIYMPIFILIIIATISMVILAIGNLIIPIVISTILFILLIIGYIYYISLTYGMVYYLFLDYPDLPIIELMKRSKQIMQGNRLRLLYLELSFIPLQFLATISFQIGSLWVTPYMHMTRSLFYLNLVQTPINSQKEELPY